MKSMRQYTKDVAVQGSHERQASLSFPYLKLFCLNLKRKLSLIAMLNKISTAEVLLELLTLLLPRAVIMKLGILNQ
jgi:hypothetical protein